MERTAREKLQKQARFGPDFFLRSPGYVLPSYACICLHWGDVSLQALVKAEVDCA